MVSELTVHYKEVLAAYKTLYLVCFVSGVISLITTTYILSRDDLPFELDPASQLCPFLLLSSTAFLWCCRGFTTAWKKVVVIGMTEVFMFILKTRELFNMRQRVVYCGLASLFLLNFQVKLARTHAGAGFLAVKHVLEWVVFDMFFFPEQFPSVLQVIVPISISFANIVINYHYTYQTRLELLAFAQSIERSHQQLEVLTEAVPDGILVMSRDLTVLKSNNTIYNLLPGPHHSLASRLSQLAYTESQRSSGHTHTVRSVIEDIKAAFDLPEGAHQILGSVRAGSKHIELQLKNVLWNSQPALIALLRDVTPVVQLEVAEAENACQLQMLQFLSHELKTPTISILGYLESLGHTSKLSAGLKDSIGVIGTSAQLLLHLINDILDYTRLLMGEFSLNKAVFHLQTVIWDTCGLISRQAAEKKLHLVVRVDNLLPTEVYSDSKRLAALLLILLTNALKYTVKGSVEVVCLYSCRNCLKVTVSDTGIGIPPERLDAVKAALQNPQGINKVGLSLCNVFAQCLGGHPLQIKSTPHKGTTISFEIDIADCRAAPLPNTSGSTLQGYSDDQLYIELPQCSGHTPNASILIVDDNDFNRMALGNILKAHNFSFIEAKHGLEAVEIVKERDKTTPVRVVFMDISMPILDGWEASRRIRELFENQEISVWPNILAYSALTGSNDISKCYESGMVYYLPKPAPAAELVKTLRTFLTDV